MLDNAKIKAGVAFALIVSAVGFAWNLRGDIVTQTQLASAMLQLDAKMGPLLTAVEKVGTRVEDVDRRLSRLEGRMDSPRSPAP